jgi:hypothetical protein
VEVVETMIKIFRDHLYDEILNAIAIADSAVRSKHRHMSSAQSDVSISSGSAISESAVPLLKIRVVAERPSPRAPE